MPTLEVKPGVSLFYLDSGVPPPSDDTYITLFVLHGHTFHSPIFSRAIAISHKYNIRFVAITRRDYHGSSLLTPEEVRVAVEGSTTQRLQAFADRAEEIMEFIKEFILKNDIPPIRANGKGGGFVLCGWSLGNLQGLSVLGFGNRFPGLVEKLEPYFRSYILYETVMLFKPAPDVNIYSPFLDASIPEEKRGVAFCEWISSYFTHPIEGLTSGDPVALNQNAPSTTKPSAMSGFTAEQHTAILDYKPPLRGDTAYYEIDPQVNEGILRNAFTQPDSPGAWPDVPVKLLWGDETAWSVIYSERKLGRLILQLLEENKGGWVRSYKSVCLPGGNHFLHWDEPEKFVQTMKRLMI